MANAKAWNREMPQTEVERLTANNEALQQLLNERDEQIDQLESFPWAQWIVALVVSTSLITSGITAWVM